MPPIITLTLNPAIDKNTRVERVVADDAYGAVEKGCFLELNAQPERLDLNDVFCKRAKELRLRVAIGADVHWAEDLDSLRYGVDQARRGWLEPDDVLNTKPRGEIEGVFN
jgi:DNA polymerase (family 10)